ncbi:RsmB/NOP family class I SAM-dependent RNA methyltransferase [Simkania negevensis]|uniref:RsmB/NOP family class I SAM-dependent RNA methyltransferase n=1 Tax=Simkania negevensis TaxID=83561 RepID=A0ABS3AV02_9BACT|nr:RsmB/NOP family class I SAM-dependent RNA methyltransferase [Simkania negevensis]
MKIPFRHHHLFTIFALWDATPSLPLDRLLYSYFRAHKAIGSKDRKFLSETVYGIVRWRGLIDHLIGPRQLFWPARYECYKELDTDEIIADEAIPAHIRCSCPRLLFDRLAGQYGIERAIELCLVSNQQAPTTIRANLLKTTRGKLLQRLSSSWRVEPTKQSKEGIRFAERANFFQLPEFKEGLFEVQDEASQLVASLVNALPGEHVLDYCSGSGGKTLAFAPGMEGRGQIYLHDIRLRALQEAKKRMQRAGVQNVQFVRPDSKTLGKLKKRMDWIMVDAPCSGTGTLRRNPDMKWRYTDEMLERLIGQQRIVFERALGFLAPHGKIIYATCSILAEENERQVDHFLKAYSLKLVGEPFRSLPQTGEMDGFFAVTMEK